MAALTTAHKSTSLFEPAILRQAIVDACRKLTPRHQLGNPVMFVVWIGSLVTTGLFFQAVFGRGEAPTWFILNVMLWLWFTVLFANFAEAMAEGRGKAQANSLRQARREMTAKKLGPLQSGTEFCPDARHRVSKRRGLRGRRGQCPKEGRRRPCRSRGLYSGRRRSHRRSRLGQ